MEISNEENADKEDPEEFGKVIDALHNKAKLPSLRTYQGDVAEFIKEKNESVVSVALKEKEKREEEGELLSSKTEKEGFRKNLTMILLSIFLIFGAMAVSYYVFKTLKNGSPVQITDEREIIPYNNLVTLTGITGATLGLELGKISPSNGVSLVKILDPDKISFQKSSTLFDFLKIPLPAVLKRILRDDYAIGVIFKDNQMSRFLVITASDFGLAFSAMLDWEKSMVEDLSFLDTGTNTNIVATTTASTTPLKTNNPFTWRDVIVKNKDTRALINNKGDTKTAYTFLNKNTILIVNNLSAIGDISAIYASRSVVR